MHDSPITLLRTAVPPEWLDYNGHMNDACYCTAFSQGSETLIDLIGMDAGYRERAGRSIFTAETHLCYVQEAREGEEVVVSGQLLGCDRKRLRLFMRLHRTADQALLATQEAMFLHVDTRARRVVPFEPAIQARVDALWQGQRQLPPPQRAGRSIQALGA